MYWRSLTGWAEAVKLVVEIITLVVAVIGFPWAVWTYRQRVKLERAKWVKELYDKFYGHSDLKAVRDLLDGDDPSTISDLVKKEPAAFSDYLNFFEFLAYLYESGQIEKKEMVGLFDYYLRNLRQNREVAAYIDDPTRGFEKLAKVLREY